MKKQLMRAVNSNLFSKFIRTTVIVIMLSGAVSANAQAAIESAEISNAASGIGKSAITFVVATNESLYFDVKVENASGEKFQIIVRDENGNTLYRGNYSDRDFNKRFKLPKGDSGKITFLIRSDSGNKTESSFEINSNTRVIEDVVVRKLN
jgi:hypothetical protein